MASGHANRTKRPNTWLHRPMLQNVKKALANPEPSTHGTLCEKRKKRSDDCRKARICGLYEGDREAMERKMTRKSSRLADDIRASLREAHNHASGKTTKAIVHRVTPKETEAREARLMLGLSQDEFAALIGTGVGTVRKWELGTRRPSGAARTLISVIKNEPKAVRRALAKANEVA